MKVNNPTLEKVAFTLEQYPGKNLPEIALAGRSNVGKSSFVNTLINRKNLARTSSQPGKTRTLNFYNIDEKFRFVDLPGYGYAVASKKAREDWADAINTYLMNRDNLKEIFLLVDFRHEPTNQDKMMYDYILDAGFSGMVIATKVDKVKKSQHSKHLSIIKKKLGVEDINNIVMFSSEDKTNKDIAWKKIMQILDIK
ncbi:MAG: YihA family ribosome biogenesis GTP-binding protein [Tissierellia bacterium]|nr:YihA family ribosome biogenesis GTP-binding protein [Tissierellia bacterium]